VLVLSTRGLGDENVLYFGGDMPRYLMNGVYFYDFLHDLPIDSPLQHAYEYFARYPALSLGHHPLLISLAQVPFYFISGISIFAARIPVILFMLLAAISWFLLTRTIYGQSVAFLSSLLLATNPYLVYFSRIVMSEIPALALIVLSAYTVFKYCDTHRYGYLFAFVVSFSLSLYARHFSIFMIPVYLSYFLIRRKHRYLVEPRMLLSYIVISILIMPLVIMTLEIDKAAVSGIAEGSHPSMFSSKYLIYYLTALWKTHITPPLLILSIIALALSIYRKEEMGLLLFLWILCCYLLIAFLGYTGERYTIYWIPPFCLLAASLFSSFSNRYSRAIVALILSVLILYQFLSSLKSEPEYVKGYEEAAKYVVENASGHSVLYSNYKDTGYFTYFVRKHDTQRKMIVLRADKILATSFVRQIIEERISTASELYDHMENFGIRYIVINDFKTQSRSLELLRQEVQRDRFRLHKTVTVESNTSSVNNDVLQIYEYKDYSPPKPGVVLDMNIPLMNNRIQVPLENLLQKPRQ
jgi:hypothetical protein